jgi:hypothetical protein
LLVEDGDHIFKGFSTDQILAILEVGDQEIQVFGGLLAAFGA